MQIVIVDPVDDGLLLDLLNTTPTVEGVRGDELAGDEGGRHWLRTHGGTGHAGELARARKLRTTLQQLVADDVAADALNPFLAPVRLRPSVVNGELAWTLEAGRDELLVARAVLAWDHLRSHAPGRLRPCANPECTLYLIDRSKANTARWCSMAVCGNRMKARRHYERQRDTRT